MTQVRIHHHDQLSLGRSRSRHDGTGQTYLSRSALDQTNTMISGERANVLLRSVRRAIVHKNDFMKRNAGCENL